MKIVESKLSNLISECFVEVLQEAYMQDRIKEKNNGKPFDVDEIKPDKKYGLGY